MTGAGRAMLIAVLATSGAGAAVAQEPADFDRALLFQSSCAPCHGVTGMGGGPVAAALKDPVPVLATLARRNGGSFPEAYVIRVIDGREEVLAHGNRVMPVWGYSFLKGHKGDGGELSVEFMIGALVEHLKSLQVD